MRLLDEIWVRVFCQSAPPERTGPHAVGTARLKLRVTGDQRRKRTLLVQLWYPAEQEQSVSIYARGLSWLSRLLHPAWAPAFHAAPLADATAFPFIAYVHDTDGRYDDNTFTLANLASHGFILAAIDNPYRNGMLNLGAGIADALKPTNGAADPLAALSARRIARGVATASALLDALLALKANGSGSAWTRRLDLGQVGILGYAMGGAVATEAALVDPRFAVAANLDGSMPGERPMVKGPYLLMLSDLSMPPPHKAPAHAPEDPSEAPARLAHYRRAQGQAALPESHVIEVAGTRREHFSDRLIFPSRFLSACRQIPNVRRIRAIIDSYTVAFFTTYLKAEPHPLMCVRHSPYPEVRFVPAPDENADWALRAPVGRD